IALLLSAQNITIPPVPVPNNPNVPITATGNSPAISIAADESGDLLRITPNNLITDDKSSDSNVVPGATPEITNTSINDPNSINNLSHGSGISKGSSHAGKNVYIKCDCGGVYSGKLKNLVKHDSSTRKCECPFELRGSTSTAKNATDRHWYLAVLHAHHNHPASHCPLAHPSHWKLTKEQNEEVSRLTKSKVKASQIWLNRWK
ncbi:hypothetical protein MJO29_006858, partial [Puccinia striiformis f. sp. tritici]